MDLTENANPPQPLGLQSACVLNIEFLSDNKHLILQLFYNKLSPNNLPLKPDKSGFDHHLH